MKRNNRIRNDNTDADEDTLCDTRIRLERKGPIDSYVGAVVDCFVIARCAFASNVIASAISNCRVGSLVDRTSLR
jgi:hypothetical protein